MKKLLKFGIASLSLAVLASAGLVAEPTVAAETIVVNTDHNENYTGLVVDYIGITEVAEDGYPLAIIDLAPRDSFHNYGLIGESKTITAPEFEGWSFKHSVDFIKSESFQDPTVTITLGEGENYIGFYYERVTPDGGDVDNQTPPKDDGAVTDNPTPEPQPETPKEDQTPPAPETPAPTPAPETPEERQARINHNLRVLRSEVERVERALTYPKLTPAEVAALEAFKAKRLETIASLEQTGELGDDNLTEADTKAFDKVLALELAGVFNDKDAEQPISTPAPKDLAADRNKLLLSVDESGLTEQQKGELAIKITFAETEKDLADLKAELVKLVKAAEKPANKPAKEASKTESKAPAVAAKSAANAPAKSDKAALPATGDVTRVGLIAAGFSLLLLGLGLAKSRKHN